MHNPAPWYVEITGQVYGPYAADSMVNFVSEGRIIPDSMISQNPQAGFIPAKASGFFRPANAQQPLSQPPNTTAATKPAVFLIMAEISSGQAMQFLHLMQRLGTAQRIGDSVWLLKAVLPIETLKNQLSSALTRQDRLFILDSFNNKTAWHNIGADMGERIQEFWKNS